MDQLDEDVAAMEKVVAHEKLVKLQREKIAAEDQMNFAADQILKSLDQTNRKSTYISPKIPKNKNSN